MSELINVDNIKEGMILAKSVINPFGQTILRAGEVLKPKHKIFLKTWNINEITIKTTDDKDEIIPEDNVKDLARSKFMKRLKWVPSNQFEQEIVEIGINSLYDKLIKNKN